MTRRWLALAPLVVVATIGAVLIGTTGSSSSGDSTLQRPALLAYEGKLLPLVQDGGRVVQQGMKPALDDLRYKHIVPLSVIAIEADGWISSLRLVRAKIEQVPSPDALTPAHQAFLSALDEYVAAATAFREAALAAPGAPREQKVAVGIRHAERADATYDRGALVLQQARRSLGLQSNPNFPEVAGG